MRNQLIRGQNLLDSFFGDGMLERFTYGSNIDIYREDNRYVVEADIPGFNKEDIHVEFNGDVLTLSAEVNEEVEDTSKKNYYYRSRSTRSFTRQIRFNDVDPSGIEAKYENGVLKVTLPTRKEEVPVTNRIEVK